MPFFRRGRDIAALGEPWATELRTEGRSATTYGMACGFFIGAETIAWRNLLPLGAFGLSAGATTFLMSLLTVPVFWPAMIFFRARARRARAEQLQTAYLAAGCCPSCGTMLKAADTPTRPRDCPSCGAVWTMPEPKWPTAALNRPTPAVE